MLAFVSLASVNACHPSHPEQLVTYAPMDQAAEIRTLARRSSLVKTVSGSGTLELTQPNGDSVVLDVAVVLRMPNHARLRAWKMGQAVFDLTVTPEGVWLETSQQGARKTQVTSAGDNAARVTRGLSLLTGGFFDDPGLTGVDRRNQLILTLAKPGEPIITCWVDRDTLTPRIFRMVDANGVERFTLSLGEYANSSGLLWPRKVTAVSPLGKIVVSLDDVEINGEIPASAFTPPARAEKLR
jgi:hypothetical protein